MDDVEQTRVPLGARRPRPRHAPSSPLAACMYCDKKLNRRSAHPPLMSAARPLNKSRPRTLGHRIAGATKRVMHEALSPAAHPIFPGHHSHLPIGWYAQRRNLTSCGRRRVSGAHKRMDSKASSGGKGFQCTNQERAIAKDGLLVCRLYI